MTVNPKRKKPVYAGLSITRNLLELAVYSTKGGGMEQAFSMPVPEGVYDIDGDQIVNPHLLKELLSQLLKAAKLKPAVLHLSLPGTLLRMVEMPRIEHSALYLSLSSEAERYKTFDNTEAVVDFVPIENHNLPTNQQQVVFGAYRSDSLNAHLKILRDLHVKAVSISLEPLNVLRALAGTGVLDSLVQQIGPDAHWGMILVEPTRVRISLWQGNRLVELRETAIDTVDFAVANQDSIVVEDMMEEIRRTTKNAQPTLWLTYNMPSAMEVILSSRLGCPFRTAPLGNMPMVQPLSHAAIGCALSSIVTFPFDFDLVEGLAHATGHGAKPGSVETTPDDGGNDWLIPAGAAALVLGVLITGGLFLMATMAAQQLPDLTSKRDSAKMEVSTLEVRQAQLKKKAELDQSLLTMVNNAKIRNHVYVALTDDLKHKTPQQLWIQTLTADDKLELVGKGLNHNSVIHFAQSFDAAPYTKAVLIDSIKEERLNGTLIYDFKISGGVSLDPSMLSGSGAESPSAPKPPTAAPEPGA